MVKNQEEVTKSNDIGMELFCPNCGEKIARVGSNFCTFCGFKINKNAKVRNRNHEKEKVEIKPNPDVSAPQFFSLWLLIPLTYLFAFWLIPVWYVSQTDAFNSLKPNKKLNKHIIKVMTVLSFFAIIPLFILLTATHTSSDLLAIMSLLFLVLYWGLVVTYIIYAYRFKNILESYTNDRMDNKVQYSSIATLLFNVLYLQYKINRIFRKNTLQ